MSALFICCALLLTDAQVTVKIDMIGHSINHFLEINQAQKINKNCTGKRTNVA